MDLKRLETLSDREYMRFMAELRNDENSLAGQKLEESMLDQIVSHVRASDVLPSTRILPENTYLSIAKENIIVERYAGNVSFEGVYSEECISEFMSYSKPKFNAFRVYYIFHRFTDDRIKMEDWPMEQRHPLLKALSREFTEQELRESAIKRREEEKIHGIKCTLGLDSNTPRKGSIQNIFAVHSPSFTYFVKKGEIFHIYMDLAEGEKIDLYNGEEYKFLLNFLKEKGNNGIPLYTLCSVFAREVEFRQNDKHTKRVQEHNEAIEAETRLYEQQAKERERLLKMQIDAQQSQINQLIQALKGGK
jgi:hypothetical protein